MESQPKRNSKVGSIYSRKHSVSTTNFIPQNFSNTQFFQGYQKDSPRYCESKRNNQNLVAQVGPNQYKGKTLNKSRMSYIKDQQRKAFMDVSNRIGLTKAQENIKSNLIAQLKNFDPYEGARTQKLHVFEAKYNKILTNYQKKKKELDQQFFRLQKNYKDKQLKKNIKNQLIGQQSHLFEKKLNKKEKNEPILIKNLNQHCQQFIQTILKQIKLEEELRLLKQNIKTSPKMREITSSLALKGIQAQQLKLSSQEYDPFNSTKFICINDVEQYVIKYISKKNQCEQHWKNKCMHNFKRQQMEKLFKILDFSQKKQLTLKDFVREINCQSGRNFRVRDLYKIYQKIKPMNLDNFVRKFSKEQ